MDSQYKIRSNRESGAGRYDISMEPREKRYPGIIMELKWKKNMQPDGLDKLAEDALNQIEVKDYDAEMQKEGVRRVLKFGIAFSGKMVRVKMRENEESGR